MKTITIEDLVGLLQVSGATMDEHYCLYRVGDGTDVLYIGITMRGVLMRFTEHMGIGYSAGESRLGRLMRSMLPDSLDWTIDLFTIDDCADLIRANHPNVSQWDSREIVAAAEEWMINRDHPCLNVALNDSPAALKAEYQVVFDTGVKEALEMLSDILGLGQ